MLQCPEILCNLEQYLIQFSSQTYRVCVCFIKCKNVQEQIFYTGPWRVEFRDEEDNAPGILF